jgi:DNA-binding PadR family transcriptional regulator
MISDIEAFSGIRLGAGTLYGAITRLEERGCIRALDTDERRRPYRLTAEGRRYLKEQLSLLDRTAKVGLNRLRRT